MKAVFRNIASSSFILLGLTPVLVILVFSLHQQSISLRMKEKMEQEKLHTIVLANVEIQWAKAGKEIWVDGSMFDIKSIEYKEDSTIFKGLFDTEETLLKQNFATNWNKNQTKNNQLFSQLFQTLQGFYFDSGNISFPEVIYQNIKFPFFSSFLQFIVLDIPTPPPLS